MDFRKHQPFVLVFAPKLRQHRDGGAAIPADIWVKTMKVCLTSVGTTGDIEPLLGLAEEFKAAGHEPVLVSSIHAGPVIANAGFEFRALEPKGEQWMSVERIRELQSLGDKSHSFLTQYVKNIRQLSTQFMNALLDRAQDADLLICGLLVSAAREVAEKLGVPYASLELLPPESLTFDEGDYSSDRERAALTRRTLTLLLTPLVRDARRHLGLPPLSAAGYTPPPRLLAYSSLLPGAPGDPKALHLGPKKRRRPRMLSDEVTQFLAAGDAPLFFGFGSMLDTDPDSLAEEIEAALAASGRRAIVVRGWGGPTVSSDRALTLDEVDYDALLPRCAAAFHHGGIGTVHCVASAGIPSCVVPFLGDQHYWAKRLVELGVAAPSLPRSELGREELLSRIHLLQDPALTLRARELGQKMQEEQASRQSPAPRILSHLGLKP